MSRRAGPITRIRATQARVERDIAGFATQGNKYASGLAREGYNGGYAQALSDVLLLLRGFEPNRHPQWWEDGHE